MKILLLGPASSIHTCRWAQGLGERGHDVYLASHHPLLDGFRNSNKFRFLSLPVTGKKGYFLNRGALNRILDELRPDLLHAHYASGYGCLATLSKFHPRVVSVWGSDIYEFPEKSFLHRRLINYILRSADKVASTSESMARRAHEICGRSDFRVTPFGVDTKSFVPRSNPKTGSFTFGTVKTLSEKYGIDILLRSFRKLLDRCPQTDLSLSIAGGGPDEGSLKKLAADLELGSRVQFLGQVPHSEVPRILQQLDIFVCLSRWESESFGVAVIEAGACALPSIVSSVGGLSEVVQSGKTGWVISKEDEEAFVELVLRERLLDRDRCHEVGLEARRQVENRYSWDKSLEIMESLYRDLLAKS